MAWNDEPPPRIEPLQPAHLPQLQALASDHLSAIAPGWALLQEIQVDQAWRNRGIGSWLIGHAAAWLRLGGCDRIILSTERDNDGARRLYERLGWQVLATEQIGWRRAVAEPAMPPAHPDER